MAVREELSVYRAARFLRVVGIWCMGAGDGMALRGEKKSGSIFFVGDILVSGMLRFSSNMIFFIFFQKRS